MIPKIFIPDYDHYLNLPDENTLVNPLIDVPVEVKEQERFGVQKELIEFYKMGNEYYSPEFGIKYLLGTNLYPFQMATIRTILAHKFPILLFSRGAGKTFLLAVYAIYHATMYPGTKIVLVSASFRQSKLIFSEIEAIYRRSPLLRAIADMPPRISTDKCYFNVCGSSIKALPLGTGDKIRGERGHVILTDEFDSIPIEVFNVVVRGFGATQSNPWAKTREALLSSKKKDYRAVGLKHDAAMAEFMLSEGNKIVLSGTAGFKNGTFYKMFRQYSKIIRNKVSGKISDYEDIFHDEEGLDDTIEVDHSDYAIVRYTYEQLPEKMMDIKLIKNARATMPKMLFDMEYMTIFGDDTHGFFKQRDIDAATAASPNGFPPMIRGKPNRNYIIGVDPAKAHDRFAVVVVELGNPNKVVNCWIQEHKRYSDGAAKIRDFCRKFNVVGIAIDEGGGGLAVEELLNKPDIMEGDDIPFYRYDEEKVVNGKKCLYMISFGSNWIDEANSLLQKNIEDCTIMFPAQVFKGDFNEKIDDAIYEINEMKKELVSIEVTHTRTGKRHFDLAPPDLKKDADGAVRHKDRYSALLLANYLAARINTLSYNEKDEFVRKWNDSLNGAGWL